MNRLADDELVADIDERQNAIGKQNRCSHSGYIAILGNGSHHIVLSLGWMIAKGDDVDMKFNEGDSAFIVESNRLVREDYRMSMKKAVEMVMR